MSEQVNQSILKEGNYYHYRILHEIAMPPDDEPYFVLETEGGTRQLLLKSFYKHYQLEPGLTIRCRVDKVNCSGKIYLEPDHPFCQPGELLHFNFIGGVKVSNSMGETEDLLLLSDPWGLPAHLQVANSNFSGFKNGISCRVDRIKKGKLLISDPERNYFGNETPPNPDQPFTISGIITLAPGLEFYVLDQGSSKHYLRTKYFNQYGFQLGDQIHLRVLSAPALYQHYLEPHHPYYTPGESYYFDFVRTENIPDSQTNSWNLVIKDTLGHEYNLEQQGEKPQWIQKVKAEVINIRMSKCQFGTISIEQ